MRRRIIALCAVISIALLGGEMFHGKLRSSSDLSIPITVWELAGLRSKSTPLFCGVPFPKGCLLNTDGLGIVSAGGQRVPAQMRILSRWPVDGSIRWLGVDFLAGIEPQKAVNYRLEEAREEKPLPDIKAEIIDGRWVIDTGTLRFQINPKRFNGFDGVWLDPRGQGIYPKDSMVPLDHAGGLSLQVNGRRYDSVEGPPVRVTVEEIGPVKAVLRVDGLLHQQKHDSQFKYTLRIVVFRGQRIINVDYTLTNFSSEPWVNVQAADFFLPMIDREQQAVVTFGPEKKPLKENVTDQAVWLAQRSEGSVENSGFLTSGMDNVSGWCDRQSGKYGVAVGLRWFTEMHPKRWVADPQGLRMEIVPADGEPIAWPSGAARTHMLSWAFHTVNDVTTVQAMAGLIRRPPVVMADAEWICSSGALGPMVASKTLLGKEPFSGVVQAYDHRFAEDLKRILTTGLAGHLLKDQGATGLFDFGDLPFVSKSDEKVLDHREDIYWSNHLYDLPSILWLQYARTADPALAEIGEIFALHMGEVDTDHISGAARVSPARLHVRDYRTRQVGAAADLSFLKNKGLMWCYYFTGNRRAHDLAMNGAQYALTVDALDLREPKTLGAGVTALLTGYELSGNLKYLEHAEGLVLRGLEWQKAHKGGLPADYTYQMGLALESYIELLQWRNTPGVDEGLCQAVDFALFHYWSPQGLRIQDDGGLTLSGPLGYAFDKTGNTKYQEVAITQLESWIKTPSTIRNARDFSLVYHNIPYLFGWMKSQKAHE